MRSGRPKASNACARSGASISAVGVVLALVVSAAFGAGDQYLGSLLGSGHVWAAGWASDVSLLSAPWVVLAFVAGATQRDPRRAALLGLSCTYAALLGYAVMTLSPVENAHVTVATLRGFVVSERLVLVGGIFTGPLFGWFGQQWRTRRALTGALVTAAARCLDAFARGVSIGPITHRAVWLREVANAPALAPAAASLA